jgi:hypothetical protein
MGADNPEMDLEELFSAAWGAQRAKPGEPLGFCDSGANSRGSVNPARSATGENGHD